MNNIRYESSSRQDGAELAELRALAMKPALVALNRFDEHRVRHRFLDNFSPENTTRLFADTRLIGFYVVTEKKDHHYLDHLYVHPDFHNLKIGSVVIERIKQQAQSVGLPIHLGALRGSKANDFYRRHGFIKTHEEEFDIYYQLPVQKY